MRALEQLAAELDPERPDHVRQALALLDSFETALREHFAFEEEGGYLADVLEVAPRLSRRARRLEQSHAGFQARLERLLELARNATGAPDKWARARRELARFLASLREHEDAENTLVRQAFNDLGRGD